MNEEYLTNIIIAMELEDVKNDNAVLSDKLKKIKELVNEWFNNYPCSSCFK